MAEDHRPAVSGGNKLLMRLPLYVEAQGILGRALPGIVPVKKKARHVDTSGNIARTGMKASVGNMRACRSLCCEPESHSRVRIPVRQLWFWLQASRPAGGDNPEALTLPDLCRTD